jgi:TPR repeat protein
MKKKPTAKVINLAQRAFEIQKRNALHCATVAEAETSLAQARHYLDTAHTDYAPDKAIALLKAAATAGHTPSAIKLVELYIFGKHCEKDTDQALDLLQVIVADNEPAAMYYLAYLYDRDPELHDPHEAAYWYRRAAEHGHFKSQIRLASLYATGTGVPCCQQTAEAFLCVALESSSQQDPRFLLWQGQRLTAQPETQFVAEALIKAAAAMQYPPAQRLLLERGWRQ